jgi:hypothetical protein
LKSWPHRNDLTPEVEQLRRVARKWTRLSAVYDVAVRVLFGPFGSVHLIVAVKSSDDRS